MLPPAQRHPINQVPGRVPLFMYPMGNVSNPQGTTLGQTGKGSGRAHVSGPVPCPCDTDGSCFWAEWNLVCYFSPCPKLQQIQCGQISVPLELGVLHPVFPASLASTLWLIAQAKQAQLWIHSKQLAFRKGFCHQFCLSYKVRNSLDTLSVSLC